MLRDWNEDGCPLDGQNTAHRAAVLQTGRSHRVNFLLHLRGGTEVAMHALWRLVRRRSDSVALRLLATAAADGAGRIRW